MLKHFANQLHVPHIALTVFAFPHPRINSNAYHYHPHRPDTPSRALSANKFALSSTEKALRWGSKDALTLSKVSCCDVRASLPNAMTEGAPCRWLAGVA